MLSFFYSPRFWQYETVNETQLLFFDVSFYRLNSCNEIQMSKTNKNKQTGQQTTISRPKETPTPQTETTMNFEGMKVALNFITPIFESLAENTGTPLVFKSVFWNMVLILHLILFLFLFWSRHFILLMCLRYLLYLPRLFFSKLFWFLLPSYIFIDFPVPLFINFFQFMVDSLFTWCWFIE